MISTTAVINMQTIKERCEVDADGCWIWTRTAAGEKNNRPYWATYQLGQRKRVNVFLPRVVAELSGMESPPKGRPLKMACGKLMCLSPQCLILPFKGSMFSQLISKKLA